MPSGPPELHKFWSEYYTDWPDERMAGSGDLAAERYLRERGFKLTRGWEWIHQAHDDYDTLTELERDAIYYLRVEWDYGGLRKGVAADYYGPQR